MPYFEELNLLFIHIPKTGGTSIERYITMKYDIQLDVNTLYNEYRPSTIDTAIKKHDKPEDKRRLYVSKIVGHSLQHLTFSEIDTYQRDLFYFMDGQSLRDKLPKIRAFTVVRNPYDRILSELFYVRCINIANSPDEVYDMLCKYLGNKCDFDNHRRPQYMFLLDKDQQSLVSDICIMKMETLQEDMKAFGFDDFNLVINTNRAKIDGTTYRMMLNKKSIDLINEYYKIDFEMFDYPMMEGENE